MRREEGHRQEEQVCREEEASLARQLEAAVKIGGDQKEVLELRKEPTSSQEERTKVASTWAQLVGGKAKREEVLRSREEEAAPGGSFGAVVERCGGEAAGSTVEGEAARGETGELREVGSC